MDGLAGILLKVFVRLYREAEQSSQDTAQDTAQDPLSLLASKILETFYPTHTPSKALPSTTSTSSTNQGSTSPAPCTPISAHLRAKL